MTGEVYFRAGVGLLIINDDHRVLALERFDVPDSWQLPQGGIAAGENPTQAAERELYEETGIRWQAIELLDVHPAWLAYELPASFQSKKTGHGQVHKWFLLKFRGSDTDIRLKSLDETQEFVNWKWIPMSALVPLVWEIRRPIYYQLALRWQEHLT